MSKPKRLTNGFSPIVRTTRRCCSNSAGCTISLAPLSSIRTWRSSVSQSPSRQVSHASLASFIHLDLIADVAFSLQIVAMLRAGTSSAVPTWPSRSIRRPTRRTNRPCTGMDAIRLSGAASASSITTSTSTGTPSTHTPVPSASIPTSPKSGSISVHSMNRVTIKSRTRSTPMLARLTWIPTTRSSRLASGYSRTFRPMVVRCPRLLVLRMCILRPTLPDTGLHR